MRGKKAAKQEEIPGTESPARDNELHALGLEIYDCQEERKRLTKKEEELRISAGQRLDALGITIYHVDGIEIWKEPSDPKLKVHLDKDSKE